MIEVDVLHVIQHVIQHLSGSLWENIQVLYKLFSLVFRASCVGIALLILNEHSSIQFLCDHQIHQLKQNFEDVFWGIKRFILLEYRRNKMYSRQYYKAVHSKAQVYIQVYILQI